MNTPTDAGALAAPLFTCSLPRPAPAAGAEPGANGAKGSRGTRRRTIDMHCHALCIAVEQLVGGHPRKRAEQEAMDAAQGAASVAHNRTMLAQAGRRLTQLAQRLADMDAMGVDVQVLSPAPNQYLYWAEDDLAEQVVRLQNEHIAQLVAQQPTRLAGLGTLAMQHPALALKQLDHAVHVLGLRGFEVSTHIEGVPLSDARYEPLWARAAELGCVVLIHPLGSEVGTRLATNYLWNVIGQPLETTIALSQLALEGVLERHPLLKLCACHGGGYLGAYWGRLDHAWRVRPEARRTPHPPSHYLKRVTHDSLVHDPAQLAALIAHVGAERVVVGTDYPFDMGHYDVHGLIDAVPGLGNDERLAIHAGNAERLLGLGACAEPGAEPTRP